mmetsp:Transcript_986/g.3497  ORF Transcript_986/g.3497 Transcript_986/m.3497 type:complete len:224 (+) Transcript_986:2323-2994(+)
MNRANSNTATATVDVAFLRIQGLHHNCTTLGANGHRFSCKTCSHDASTTSSNARIRRQSFLHHEVATSRIDPHNAAASCSYRYISASRFNVNRAFNHLVDPNRYPLCLGRRRLPNSNAGKSFGKPGAQHAVLSLRACLDGLFRDALISMQGEAMQVFTRERVAGNFVPELPGQKLLCLAAKLLRRLRLSGDDPYDATVERLHVDGRGALRAYGRPAVVPPPGL